MTVSGTDHRDERKRTLAEVSKAEGRRQNWGQSLLQEEPSGNLLTGWVASGIKRA
jgi:hypothetical protein